MKSTDRSEKGKYSNLVALLKQHDRKAFEFLYDNYSKALFGIVLQIVKEHELAEEVFHDAFVKIHRHIGSYDEKKSRLFTWMLNICRNAAIDKLKSKAVKKQQLTDGMEAHSEHLHNGLSIEFNPDHIGMRALLDELNPDYSFVLQKLYFQGYSQLEISEEYDIPLGTVKTRTRAALRDLRRMIA